MNKVVFSKEFKWIENLLLDGYKYMLMPKGNRAVLYATKETKRMKNGKFYANSEWDEFRLGKEDSWIPGAGTRDVYIKLNYRSI